MTDIKILILCTIILALGIGSMLWVSGAYAEGIEYDAYTIPSITVTCSHPTARTDGTAFLPEEYGNIDLYLSGNNEPYYSGPECGATISLGPLKAGQYYVQFTQSDKDGRVSDKSDPHPFFLHNIAPPNPPTNVGIL